MEYLKLVRRVGLAWVAVLAIVGACTGSPELAQKGQQVGAATITTDQTNYAVSAPITASWTNLPGNVDDWIAIVPAGSPADSGFLEWHYTNGQVNGSQMFAGLTTGTYEARAYLAGTYTILGSTTFSVSSVTTDKQTYYVNEQVTVSWTGMPGNAQDWVTIVPAGSPPDSGFIEYHFTNGQPSGMQVFQGLATPGTYEARAYQGGTYTVLASTTFAVTGSGGGGTCTPPSTPPVIGSINSGDLVLDATQNVNTVALTVAFANSILFTSVRESEPSPQYGGVMCTLHDVDMVNNRPAGVTCQRGAPGTDTGNGTITVHYTVVTFTSGVTVQRGIADTHTTDPQTVALTTVDPTSSFVVLNGITVLGTGWGNNEFVRAQLVDGSTLSIQTAVAGAETSWQVVTMTGASVQRGTASFATGDTQQAVAITAAPSGSMVLASYTTDNQSGIAASALMLEASLQDPSTVLLSRGSGGSNLSVSWEVVSLPFAVHSGIASFAAGQSTASASIAGISASTSVGLAAGQAILGQSGGSTTYAGSQLDLVGEAAATLVTGSGSVQLDRASTQASAEIPWQVIDFAHNCNGL